MRLKGHHLLVLLGACAALACPPAQAARTLARIVSRANCLVPLPKLSLVQSNGYTFNESISWDPYVWVGHRAISRSNHYRSTFWGGFWSDYLINSYQSGSYNDQSWRVWAGKVDKGDTRELPNPYRRPVRFVTGHHWEILDGTTFPYYRSSGATNCNITTW